MSLIGPPCPALVVATANSTAALLSPAPRAVIERMLRQCGRSNGPWHTAFVHFVGHAAHLQARTGISSWPLPATADCDELARFGDVESIVVRRPREGDVALLWSRREARFVRSGIVVRTDVAWYTTMEGDVGERGVPGGPNVQAVRHRLGPESGHRFLRWADLDQRLSLRRAVVRLDSCVARMTGGRP